MLDRIWPWVRPVMFRLDAERAHTLTLRGLRRAGWALKPLCPGPPAAGLEVQLGPLRLPGPVGLAAGLDKDGMAIDFWPHLGFGWIEIGTVTAHPQPGNPRPRLFRYPAQRAIINRMGFNNAGSAALAQRIRALKDADAWPAIPVGANVGKSKITPLDEAPADYATSVRRLAGLVDWFTVNVSSPNTEGLRDLQQASMLEVLLPEVLEAAAGTPVLLKLAPDLTDDAIWRAVPLARDLGVTAIVATNTTNGRDGLVPDPGQTGGLSGRPLWPLARDRIGVVLAAAEGLPVVGVGGIEGADQVRELLDAGCSAVQLYTALVFEGPGLPARIHRDLRS